MAKFGVPQRNPEVWQTLTLNGKTLPGIVQNVRLGGSLSMQKETVNGKDGTILANAQWDEDTATFTLKVSSETEIDALSEFTKAYKARPGQRPQVVFVQHPLLRRPANINARDDHLIHAEQLEQRKNIITVDIGLTNINPKLGKRAADRVGVTPRAAITPDQAAAFDFYDQTFVEGVKVKPSDAPPPVKP
jgi:hypothetical protein